MHQVLPVSSQAATAGRSEEGEGMSAAEAAEALLPLLLRLASPVHLHRPFEILSWLFISINVTLLYMCLLHSDQLPVFVLIKWTYPYITISRHILPHPSLNRYICCALSRSEIRHKIKFFNYIPEQTHIPCIFHHNICPTRQVSLFSTAMSIDQHYHRRYVNVRERRKWTPKV